MPGELILFDLPSPAPCRSWSGNVWKTRLVLNFKDIPYKTKWVPYIHLQETLKATGLEPNPPGSWSPYSVPTIQFSDGSYLMDSAAIAVKLDSMYPQPSLRLNSAIEDEAQAAVGALFMSLATYLIPFGIKSLVAEEDAEWFKADRASRFGMTVEQLMAEKDADETYAAAQPAFEKCREVLTRHKKDTGPFILGSEVSYADFYLVSLMQMFARCGHGIFEKFLKEAGPELRNLYQACQKWTVKQT